MPFQFSSGFFAPFFEEKKNLKMARKKTLEKPREKKNLQKNIKSSK